MEPLPTTENCRYCLMCRHVCPVGHVTRLETLTPHGWGLTIESVKRNLLEWNDETIDLLADATWVRVSVDCFSAETYAKTRHVKEEQFYKVIENIKKTRKRWVFTIVQAVINILGYRQWHGAAGTKETEETNRHLSRMLIRSLLVGSISMMMGELPGTTPKS